MAKVVMTTASSVYTVSGKKEATVFLGITLDKFKHSFVIFGTNHPDTSVSVLSV